MTYHVTLLVSVVIVVSRVMSSKADHVIENDKSMSPSDEVGSSSSSSSSNNSSDNDNNGNVVVAGSSNLDVNKDTEKNDIQDDVAMAMLLPDAEAVYERLFIYELPRTDEASGRAVKSYQIFPADRETLPGWLVWNENASSLEGIPSNDIVGQKYQIVVVARLNDHRKSNDRDGDNDLTSLIGHFFITIAPAIYGVPQEGYHEEPSYYLGAKFSSDLSGSPGSASGMAPGFGIECTKPGTAVTKAMVVLDSNLLGFSTKGKIQLVKKLAEHLRINPLSVSLKPVVNLHILEVSALVTGAGNVDLRMSTMIKEREGSRPVELESSSESTLIVSEDQPNDDSNTTQELEPLSPSYMSLQWVVGCGNVQAEQMEVLVELERSSSSGQLTTSLGGLGVLAWYVVNNKPPRKYKRSANRNSRHKHREAMSEKQSLGDGFELNNFYKKNNGDWDDIYAGSGYDTPYTDDPTGEAEITVPVPPTTTTTTPKPTKKPKPHRRKTTTHLPKEEAFGPIDKLDLYAGRPFHRDLLKERFTKNGAKDYTLSSKNSDSLPPNSWIKLNSTSFRLYGFPLENDVGKHEFKLTALTKSSIATTNFTVEVFNNDPPSRPNHEFCMTLSSEYEKFIYDVESRIDVAKKLAEAFGGVDPQMTVLGITKGSVVYTWFNNSLPQDSCDDEGLLHLMDRFISSNGVITDSFKKSLEPHETINASISTFGTCSHIPPRPNYKGGVFAPDTEVTRDKIDSDRLFYMIIGFIVAAAVILVILFVVLLLFCRQKRKNDQEKQKQLFKTGVPSKGVPVIFAEELQAAEKEEDKRSQKGEEGLPDTARSTLRSKGGLEDSYLNWDKKGVPPPEYQPPRPGSRDATLKKNQKGAGLEGSGDNAKSILINSEDSNSDDVKVPLNDDEENIDDFFSNRTNNFKRANARIMQENCKNQLIVSDID